VKSLGESRRLPALAEVFAKVGESRELVGRGVEEGKDVEQLASHGESCSKLGGECDSTGVVALPGVVELTGFSIRAGVLEAFLEGVRGPELVSQGLWQVLDGDG